MKGTFLHSHFLRNWPIRRHCSMESTDCHTAVTFWRGSAALQSYWHTRDSRKPPCLPSLIRHGQWASLCANNSWRHVLHSVIHLDRPGVWHPHNWAFLGESAQALEWGSGMQVSKENPATKNTEGGIRGVFKTPVWLLYWHLWILR